MISIWREYELLELNTNIDSNIGEKSVHLLKMTCPSTGDIHVLRVPPSIKDAHEAAKWINHDIDPESFEIET